MSRPHAVSPMDPVEVAKKYLPITEEVTKRIVALELAPPNVDLAEELGYLATTHGHDDKRDVYMHIAAFALKLAADIPGDL